MMRGLLFPYQFAIEHLMMGSFAKDISKWAKQSGLDVEQVVRATILEMSTEVTLKTPVGNPDLWKSPPPAGYTGGQARGNWFPSIDLPSTEVDKQIVGKNANEDSNQRVWTMLDLAFGKRFFLVNNLPYIRRLEYGWSTQAPAGMVRSTQTQFKQIVKDEINKLK